MQPGQEEFDDELLFNDPMLMQQLGLGGPQQFGQQAMPESSPSDRESPPQQAWATGLILIGILMMLAWVAVPIGGLGAWVYGPIEGFFAQPIYSRFEFMMCGSIFITIGVVIALFVQSSMPKVHWVENDPGVPRTTFLREIEDTGGTYILTRRDKKKIRVRKDMASRYRKTVHVTANVLEIDARPGSDYDIEFRTTQGSMSRGQIDAEEDVAQRQGFREQQLEEISQQYVAGQMEQIEGVG